MRDYAVGGIMGCLIAYLANVWLFKHPLTGREWHVMLSIWTIFSALMWRVQALGKPKKKKTPGKK